MATIKDLTGGTGDVNPQLLNLTVTQTAADTTTTLEQPLPVPRVGVRKGRSVVIEILWIRATFADIQIVTPSAGSITAVLSTAPTAATVVDSRTFWVADFEALADAAPTTRNFFSRSYVTTLHDGAGHGYLVATDAIFLSLASVASGIANAVNLKIAYRFKEVGLEEYIGIVAGQQ